MIKNNKEILEITWFSRGGQGAKTSSLLFGEAALEEGYFIQAFPEYGPERAGAPMKVYNRISKNFIRFRTPIKNSDIIIVLDSSLLNDQVKIFFNKPITFLINSSKSEGYLKNKYRIKGKVLSIDASKISLKYLGKSIPSVVMLGALIGFLKFDLKKIIPELRVRLEEKLNINLVLPNIAIIKETYKIIEEKIK